MDVNEALRGACNHTEGEPVMDRGMNKIIIVRSITPLESLKQRYNTFEQARFYIEHLGADFSDYVREHEQYCAAISQVRNTAMKFARVQVIEKSYIPNMIFGKEDIVITIGRDGLAANVMKYLEGQPLIGVNSDTARWEGNLLNFEPGDMERVIPMVIAGNHTEKTITMGMARTKDGQTMYAVNDFFVGINNHTSARYQICYNGFTENQSSSGVIISTGLGMTGWHKSVMAEFSGMARAFGLPSVPDVRNPWDSDVLLYQVREPYPSKCTGAELVFGRLRADEPLVLFSQMPEDGVVFSDGVPEDAIEFNAGMELTVQVADRHGHLVAA